MNLSKYFDNLKINKINTCRRLHSATRQQRRVSCGTHTNIYFSGELSYRSQSLNTIQRTHYEDQDFVNPKLEWRHRGMKQTIIVKYSFIYIFHICSVETRCYNPFTTLVWFEELIALQQGLKFRFYEGAPNILEFQSQRWFGFSMPFRVH